MKQPRQNQKTRRKRPGLPASARSKLLDELTEVTRHRAAISEVLRAIASSPHDLQPIFDTILDSAGLLFSAKPTWAVYASASKQAFVWLR